MHKVSVFWIVSIGSEFAVKLGVLQWHLLFAVDASLTLLCPLQNLEMTARHGLSTLIVTKFFGYFPPEGEKQKRIASCHVIQPLTNFTQ